MILTSTARAASLADQKLENNPAILWNNLIDSYTAPDGTVTGGEAENLLSYQTHKYVIPNENAGVWRVEFTTTDEFTMVGLASHNLAAVGATVTLESWDGAAWVENKAGGITPTDNNAIAWRIARVTASKWSIKITGATAQPSFAVLMAGQETIIPQRIYQGYTPPMPKTPNRVRHTVNVSGGHHYLGSSAITMGSELSASVTLVADDWVRGDDFSGFQAHYNKARPFFWCWRAAKYNEDLLFVWSTGGTIRPTNSGPRALMSFDMSMGAHHDP